LKYLISSQFVDALVTDILLAGTRHWPGLAPSRVRAAQAASAVARLARFPAVGSLNDVPLTFAMAIFVPLVTSSPEGIVVDPKKGASAVEPSVTVWTQKRSLMLDTRDPPA
jgi:hypothetical protein